jgi:hypothetical protein
MWCGAPHRSRRSPRPGARQTPRPKARDRCPASRRIGAIGCCPYFPSRCEPVRSAFRRWHASPRALCGYCVTTTFVESTSLLASLASRASKMKTNAKAFRVAPRQPHGPFHLHSQHARKRHLRVEWSLPPRHADTPWLPERESAAAGNLRRHVYRRDKHPVSQRRNRRLEVGCQRRLQH